MDQNEMTASIMAQYVDHTLLKADAQQSDFDKLCDEAKQFQFKAVCVNSCRVAYVANKLEGSGVEVCSVVGFPLGAMETGAKAYEARRAIENGATEVDMVINVGALKSGDFKTVDDDIRALRKASEGSVALKVIIETCLLTDEEKTLACEIAKKAGADFVKSSTGFSTGGATIEDIVLMRKVVGSDLGVKASGGIKDFETAFAMIKAGATRLGTSSGVAIVEGIPK
jgi:deoxyribose-phosphate aldolase